MSRIAAVISSPQPRETTFRFAEQQASPGHFAEIDVRALHLTSTGIELRVSPIAFDWLKYVYGPDALEWAKHGTFRGGPVRGVAHPLQHTTTEVDERRDAFSETSGHLTGAVARLV